MLMKFEHENSPIEFQPRFRSLLWNHMFTAFASRCFKISTHFRIRIDVDEFGACKFAGSISPWTSEFVLKSDVGNICAKAIRDFNRFPYVS